MWSQWRIFRNLYIVLWACFLNNVDNFNTFPWSITAFQTELFLKPWSKGLTSPFHERGLISFICLHLLRCLVLHGQSAIHKTLYSSLLRFILPELSLVTCKRSLGEIKIKEISEILCSSSKIICHFTYEQKLQRKEENAVCVKIFNKWWEDLWRYWNSVFLGILSDS